MDKALGKRPGFRYVALACGAAAWLMMLAEPWWWMGFACAAMSVMLGAAGLRRQEGPHWPCVTGLASAIGACLASFLALRVA